MGSRRKQWEGLTPEERRAKMAACLEARRRRWALTTPEERKVLGAKIAAVRKRNLAKLTPEERQARADRIYRSGSFGAKMRAAAKRQREERPEVLAESIRRRVATRKANFEAKSAEEKEAICKKAAATIRKTMRKLTRAQRLERARKGHTPEAAAKSSATKRLRLARMTPEERAKLVATTHSPAMREAERRAALKMSAAKRKKIHRGLKAFYRTRDEIWHEERSQRIKEIWDALSPEEQRRRCAAIAKKSRRNGNKTHDARRVRHD